MLRIMKVMPHSKGEDRAMELFTLTGTLDKVTIRRGSDYGHPEYDEYEFDAEVFGKVRNYLMEEKA